MRRVFVDVLPGDPPQPRLNFSVERGGDTAFILSQTRALVPFTAIPQGTHRLRASHASGFAGPSGSGEDLAYLRWRADGVTFEFAATLSPWLMERDVVAMAEALIERHAVP